MITEMSTMNSTTNLCFIRAEDYREVELTMLGAPVSVHVIHVSDPTGSGAAASTSQKQGLEHLAGVTGHRITRLWIERNRDGAARGVGIRLLPRHVHGQDSERNGMIRPLSVKINRRTLSAVASKRRHPAARASKPGAKPWRRATCSAWRHLPRPPAACRRVHLARGLG